MLRYALYPLLLSLTLGLLDACLASTPEYECSLEDDIDCPAGFVCLNDVKKCAQACVSSRDCPGASDGCVDSACQLWVAACDSQTPCLDDAWFCNASGVCQKYPASVNCSNAVMDGDEADVDCGGSVCQACVAGKACVLARDCVSSICIGDMCQASCTDNVRDGDEADIDCGGSCPTDCADGQVCASDDDCTSAVCVGQICQPPSCLDGTQNADETCTDAGGSCPDNCADGQGCLLGDDCTSRVCADQICQSPTCSDRTQNQSELGIDCGSVACATGCPDDSPCQVREDCTSRVCTNLVCVPASCDDGVRNRTETDIDCGGVECPPCRVGQACSVAGDCDSRVCSVGACGEAYPIAAASGYNHSCALLTSGQVKCWGYNLRGQLGLGDTQNRGDTPSELGDNLPAVLLGNGRTAVAVAAGGEHTCALLDDGQVKCWGSNARGQLGQGDTQARGDNPSEMGDNLPAVELGTGRTASAVSAGSHHTCVLLDAGEVKCWGNNGTGELGLGDTSSRGDGPGEMGDNLPAVSLGTDRIAIAITANGDPGNYTGHSCALLDTHQVRCWGYNNTGQLGLGDTQSRGDGPGEMGDSLPVVSLGTGRTALSLSAGTFHTCVILDSAQVKCWGFNIVGQLGLGDTQTRGDGAGEMGDSLPVVSLGSSVLASAVSMETYHSCALLNTGDAKCWGSNGVGQLGLGNTQTRGDGPGEMGDSLPAVFLGTGLAASSVSTGGGFSCALAQGQVKCWGGNAYGQLGVGDTAGRGDEPGEMGDALLSVDF